MKYRISVACVLLAAALPGLLFAPVFGLWPLVAPIAAALVACYAVVELCLWWPSGRPWRPVLAVVAGLVAVAETELRTTTVAGLPTAVTARALAAGVTQSWQLTLQSTWPVRPDAETLLFVPLLVLFAAVLGVELLRWPALAALPGLLALGLSQTFVAASGPVATLAGLGYAVLVAGLFLTSRTSAAMPAAPASRSASSGAPAGRGVVAGAVVAVPTVVLGVAAAVAVTAVDQGRQPPYSVQRGNFAAAPLPRTVSPLSEVSTRLKHPDVPVFGYTTDGQVDRWRLVVLENFNGVTWTAADRYRRLGAEVGPQPSVTVPTSAHVARLTVPAGSEPWLPSQAMPAAVVGAAPLVDPASGMLLLPERAGPVAYDLRWWEPEVEADRLVGAALDSGAATGDLGVIPPGVADLARTATGGMRPSFQAALVLERYLSRNYRVATGADLPTGSGWPQLREFLLDTRRGTSEQFAAAYVVLARIVGIPARLAVGYRAPRPPTGGQVVVRNADALAWPEVAVSGVGWIPLDPTGAAGGSGSAPTRLAEVTAKARADLPPPHELQDPPLAPSGSDRADDGDDSPVRLPVVPILLGLLALLAAATGAIPLAKMVRTARRRRRAGVPGVVAAWWDARDLLRAHGVPIAPGTTVRDAARMGAERSVVDGLTWLAAQVDIALWSGAGANETTVVEAWTAVRNIRRGLAARPLAARVRAWFDPRDLFGPKTVTPESQGGGSRT